MSLTSWSKAFVLVAEEVAVDVTLRLRSATVSSKQKFNNTFTLHMSRLKIRTSTKSHVLQQNKACNNDKPHSHCNVSSSVS